VHPALTTLTRVDELDRLLAESENRPLLVFKHSYSCGASFEALDELIDHLNGPREDDTAYAIVTVQTHRDVSNAVEARLGVRHQTPQALLVRDGRVVWSASHFRVTAQAVAGALRNA
jgi:bacillithiol system protein YtxJ